MKRNYIIWAPDYVEGSAGVRVLYMLALFLERMGFQARIVMAKSFPNYLKLKPITPGRAISLLSSDNWIVIYPETVPGNPLGARNVVRWVLNHPGFLGGQSRYHQSELVFTYSDAFKKTLKNSVAGKLFIPTISEELFNCDGVDTSQPRDIDLYYVGKSIFKSGYFDESKSIEITRNFPSRKELPILFRMGRVLYSFDNSTALIYEAALCGCPAVVIPDGTQTKSDYEALELGMSGIAWGVEGLSLARTTIGGLRAAFTKAKADSLAMIDDFVKLTQSHDFVADVGDKNWRSGFSDLELEIRSAMNGKIFNSFYWLLVNFQNFTHFNRVLLRWLRTRGEKEKIGTSAKGA